MNAYALTTVARAKLYLGITTSADDTLIERLIDVATDTIESFCGRRFKKTTYTDELYDGTGGDSLVLKQYPVVAGQAFTLNERAGSDNVSNFSTLSSNIYFVKNDRGIVQFSSGIFLPYPQRYKITYTAGYDFDNTTPGATAESVGLGDLEEACWQLVGNAYSDRKHNDAVASESIGNYSVSFRRDISMSASLKATLERYRRVSV